MFLLITVSCFPDAKTGLRRSVAMSKNALSKNDAMLLWGSHVLVSCVSNQVPFSGNTLTHKQS